MNAVDVHHHEPPPEDHERDDFQVAPPPPRRSEEPPHVSETESEHTHIPELGPDECGDEESFD